jgi:hypothetical protein
MTQTMYAHMNKIKIKKKELKVHYKWNDKYLRRGKS